MDGYLRMPNWPNFKKNSKYIFDQVYKFLQLRFPQMADDGESCGENTQIPHGGIMTKRTTGYGVRC
jgi:hypothetical protein